MFLTNNIIHKILGTSLGNSCCFCLYLECSVWVWQHNQNSSFFICIGRFDELSGWGGDFAVLCVIGDLDLLFRNKEDQLGNVFIGFLGLISVIPLNHFLNKYCIVPSFYIQCTYLFITKYSSNTKPGFVFELTTHYKIILGTYNNWSEVIRTVSWSKYLCSLPKLYKSVVEKVIPVYKMLCHWSGRFCSLHQTIDPSLIVEDHGAFILWSRCCTFILMLYYKIYITIQVKDDITIACIYI